MLRAEPQAARWPGLAKRRPGGGATFTGRVSIDLQSLAAPSRVVMPHVIAVAPYTDLMLAPDWFLASVFRVMTEGAHWHIYVLQTRRPLKLAGWLRDFPDHHRLWVGLSAYDQPSLEQALDDLAALPTPNRWLAVKPQLEPVVLPKRTPEIVKWLTVAGSRGHVFDWIDPETIDNTVRQGKKLGLPVFLEHYCGRFGKHTPDMANEVPWTICLPKWLR